jgi:RNA polymerase sigma-70 factor (ECF subfamily)
MPDAPDDTMENIRAWLRRCAAVLLDHRLRGKVDPSDIVHDALLKAVRHQDQLRGQSEPERRAWLRRILANTLADLVRRYVQGRKRNVGREQSLHDALVQSSAQLEEWLADSGASPSGIAENNERLLWLAEGLAELPDDQRRAVQLRHLEQMSVREVAQEMDRTPTAVAGLLRRGLEALRARGEERS